MPLNEQLKINDHILLTGAGFSKNFGAPLAAEMWSIIMGSPFLREHLTIRKILLENFDFESVFQGVIDGPLSTDEKEAINNAVYAAYQYIDKVIMSRAPSISLPSVRKMISRFAGKNGQLGFVFTLNQDLFLERNYRNLADPPLSLPGIARRQRWFTEEFRGPIDSGDQVRLPQESPTADEILRQAGFYYVKLHGSMNWYDEAGRFKLVIGNGKTSTINKEPLLAAYLDTFRKVLCSGSRKLLCVGYGFGDKHINEVILEAAGHGLQLYVLGPGSPINLKEQFKKFDCAGLWKVLAEYFPFDFITLFPEGHSELTPQFAHILRSYFDDSSGAALSA